MNEEHRSNNRVRPSQSDGLEMGAITGRNDHIKAEVVNVSFQGASLRFHGSDGLALKTGDEVDLFLRSPDLTEEALVESSVRWRRDSADDTSYGFRFEEKLRGRIPHWLYQLLSRRESRR